MSRRLAWVCFAYICGIVVGRWAHVSVEIWVVSMIAWVGLQLVMGIKDKRHILLTIVVVFFMIGCLRVGIVEDTHETDNICRSDSKQVIIGTIVDKEPANYGRLNYVVKTEGILWNGEKIYKKSKKILVRVYVNGQQPSYLPDQQPSFFPGDRVRIEADLDMPHGQRNPGGFDYRRYLLGKGITMVCSITPDNMRRLRTTKSFNAYRFLYSIKEHMYRQLDNGLKNPGAGIGKALVFGDTGYIDSDILEGYRETGIGHMLAVSGLHVGLLVMLVHGILKYLRANKWLSFILTGIFLIMYIIITGGPASVIRASVMTMVVLFSQLAGRKVDGVTSVLFSAFFITLIWPLQLFDVGFQLSFVVTLSIILYYSKISQLLAFLPKYIKDAVSISLASQIGIIPVTALYFNYISPLSPVINLIMVPLLSLVLVLIIFMLLSGFIFHGIYMVLALVSSTLINLGNSITAFFHNIAFSIVDVPYPSPVFMVPYYISAIYGAVAIYRPKFRKRSLPSFIKAMVVSCCVFIAISIANTNTKYMEITLLDVGQGDSVVVSTPSGHNILIDCGPGPTGGEEDQEIWDAGKSTVLPYLRYKGINRLDAIFISHPHDDHMGGLSSIINTIKVDRLYMPPVDYQDSMVTAIIEEARENNVPMTYITDDHSIKIGDWISIKAVHPPDTLKASSTDTANDSSLVLLVTYKRFKMLLAGDIGKLGEQSVLASGNDINADILKVPHHGSKTSSSPEFIDRINPIYALISVGNNNYGHPSDEVMERYRDNGTEVITTKEAGAITIITDGTGFSIKGYINQNGR
ncbi:MAG: DNA internalization-related competence protein ComEC/Rec2 [Mahellales bacterium]|jgi:competence protein ComEC